MESEPVANAGFIAYEQGFEAVESSVGVFDDSTAAVKLGVKEGVVVGLPIGRAAVAGNVGFDVTGGTGLAQLGSIKRTIGVQGQPSHGNAGGFEQHAKFLKQCPQAKAVVVVARLRGGTG